MTPINMGRSRYPASTLLTAPAFLFLCDGRCGHVVLSAWVDSLGQHHVFPYHMGKRGKGIRSTDSASATCLLRSHVPTVAPRLFITYLVSVSTPVSRDENISTSLEEEILLQRVKYLKQDLRNSSGRQTGLRPDRPRKYD
uniref:OB_NTP_bind domain-containing protein n=1 Tax=Steinernema glaseri TaxID=37863 RepID=A0A1I7ZTX6_9BILA